MGTHTVGRFFGPIIFIWFSVLGITGILQIIQAPSILTALNPLNGLYFLLERGSLVRARVGAIVLALTGAEALYADMGHFGKKPIQLAWLGMVLPALALNYLGQGALLMRDPSALENPFYRMFPEFLMIPAVVLAAMAAIIASQAVISGAYSMTKQADPARLSALDAYDTDIPSILEDCKQYGLEFSAFETTYFLSRETVMPTQKVGMLRWREKLFAAMSRNSGDIAEFFKLPDNAVVELGTRIQI